MCSEREEKPKSVRLDMTGLLKEKFDFLQKKYGATTRKELVAILITEKYEQLKKEEEKETSKE